MGVSIRPVANINHVEEAIGIVSLVEGASDHLFTIWALRFIEQIDLHFIIGGLHETKSKEC